jgi:hypothetical protein
MEKAPVNFKQQRDFGEVFNATFAFIGQEIKPLGKAVLFFVLPILIITAILQVFVGIEYQKFVGSMQANSAEIASNPFAFMGGIYKYMFFYLLIYLLAFSALRCTIYAYIKIYVEKGKDQFTTDDIWVEVKKFFLPVIGTSLLIGILIGFGYIFCVLPGIWLNISLSLIYIAMVFEGKGMGNAFSRSFNLTKLNWWTTLAILLVCGILVYILNLILSLPAMLLGIKSLFSSFKNLEEGGAMNFSTTYFVVTAITSLISYILFSIPVIAMAFQYFNLREVAERPSLDEKIEQIG